MANPAILLAVVVILLVNAVFIAAIVHCRFDLMVMLFYVSSLLLYTTLYFWRRLRAQCYRHALLRRGLGYAALGLAAFLSALFFYSFSFAAPGMPVRVGIAAWLLLALPAAYCLYRIIVLHLEEEGDVRARVMEDQV